MATNFTVGRSTASAIASTSRKSFFCPFEYPAPSQLDWLISMTAISVPCGSREDEGSAHAVQLLHGVLRRFISAPMDANMVTARCHSLELLAFRMPGWD